MMKWTSKLLPLSIALAVGALLAAYVPAGKIACILGLLVAGIAWLLAVYHGWRWLGSLCAFSLLGLLLLGGLFHLPPAWLLGGMLAVLAAWDLEHFRRRTLLAGRIESGKALELRHLGRLAIVLGIGGGLAGLSSVLRLRLHFAVALLLTLLVAVSLSRLVMRLRRLSD
jgi:hypothetical protein